MTEPEPNNQGDNADNDMRKGRFIALDITESLQQEQILTAFVVNSNTGCIVASLNHVYNQKTIVSGTYQDWIRTIDTFTIRAKQKRISDKHIMMLTDALDNNNEKVMQCYYDQIKDGNAAGDRIAAGLELVKGKLLQIRT